MAQINLIVTHSLNDPWNMFIATSFSMDRFLSKI